MPTPRTIHCIYKTTSKCTKCSLPLSSLDGSYYMSQRKWFLSTSNHGTSPICPKDQCEAYDRQCPRDCLIETRGGSVEDGNATSQYSDRDCSYDSVQQPQESTQETKLVDKTCCVSMLSFWY